MYIYIYIGKGSKPLNQVKPVQNINKKPEKFSQISPVQMKVPASYKLQDIAYE